MTRARETLDNAQSWDDLRRVRDGWRGPLLLKGVMSEHDARLAIVVLTEAGARIVGDMLPTAEEAATRVLGRLWSGDEQQRASALLQRARG